VPALREEQPEVRNGGRGTLEGRAEKETGGKRKKSSMTDGQTRKVPGEKRHSGKKNENPLHRNPEKKKSIIQKLSSGSGERR